VYVVCCSFCLEKPICPSSRVNESKKNATGQMKEFIWGCAASHCFWGGEGTQRGSVRVMLIWGCGSEKRDRAYKHKEPMSCVRVSMLTWKSVILNILSICVCVCVRACVRACAYL
jgi:hypothetical protein